MPVKNQSFHGTIKVASRIIDYLSSGLYHSPAACLKELINNSYDARATEVNIFVKPDADRIIIEDNGIGMSRGEFQAHFDHISESHKRDNDAPIGFGRRKIGKIGIGFIAANEICDRMEIFSTKKDSNELLHVTIDFAEMRKPLEERRVSGGSEIIKADYDGEILEAPSQDHFTKLFLLSVRGEARQILAGATHSATSDPSTPRSLYGLAAESIGKLLQAGDIKTWKEFDAYSETLLQIGLNVPVPYHDDWISSRLAGKVNDIAKSVASLQFSVNYDGTEMKKPIVFPSNMSSDSFIDRFEFEGKHVSASGYFYAQHGTISPRELHGLLVRIRHAAVGEYDPQFWGFASTEASLLQRWVSAEIEADDRLEVAMNIDRRTLRVVNSAYLELQEAIHNHLRKVLKKVRQDIYSVGRETRKVERSRDAYRQIMETSRNELKEISPAVARIVEQQWSRDPKLASAAATQELSVSELYKLVIQTASEVLDEDDARRFVARLTEKLLS